MTAGRRTQPLLLGLLLAAAVACSAARELHAAAPPLASLPGDAQRMPTSSQPQSAIVGGTNAPVGRFRYMASLRHRTNGNHFCGGSLIHERVVLTAAHCVVNHDSGLPFEDPQHRPSVRLGGYNLYADGTGAYEARTTVQTRPHPNFKVPRQTNDFMNNDVALLLLDAPATMPRLSLIGHKPKPANPVPDNTVGRVVGWGFTAAGGPLASILQQVEMSVLPVATCQGAWTTADWGAISGNVAYAWSTNTFICAGKNFPNAGAGFCAGDSGGPFIVDGGSAAADRQMGIVSWGPGKCGETVNTPYVFTDVGEVFPWINQQVFEMTGDWLVPPVAPATTRNPDVRGFDLSTKALPGAANAMQQIVSYPGRWGLSGLVSSGPAPLTNVLTYTVWRWGNVVVQLAVNAQGGLAPVALTTAAGVAAVPQNSTSLIAGGWVRYLPWVAGQPKQINIVQPGVHVLVSQPWAGGKWQPWLNLRVTLTQPLPSGVRLGGPLGATLPSTASGAAWTNKVGFVLASGANAKAGK